MISGLEHTTRRHVPTSRTASRSSSGRILIPNAMASYEERVNLLEDRDKRDSVKEGLWAEYKGIIEGYVKRNGLYQGGRLPICLVCAMLGNGNYEIPENRLIRYDEKSMHPECFIQTLGEDIGNNRFATKPEAFRKYWEIIGEIVREKFNLDKKSA